MANNRLYLVNRETKEYCLIAKDFGGGWQLGNKQMFLKMIESEIYPAYGTNLHLFTENDTDEYNKYIGGDEGYTNINDATGKWEYNWDDEDLNE